MSQEKNTAHNVQCPKCSASLKVFDLNKVHMCPVCANLGRVRLMRKYVKCIDDTLEQAAVVCTDEKLDEHLETAAEAVMPTPPVEEATQEVITNIASEDSKAQKLEIPFDFEDTDEEVDAEETAMGENIAAQEESAAELESETGVAARTKIKKEKRVKDVGELIFYICLIALPILQLAIFYVYVNFNSVLMSFQSYDTLNNKFTWDFTSNFVKLWDDIQSSVLIDALIVSVVIWIWTAVIGRFLAILFSYYVYKKWFLGTMFKFFLFLPSILPGILLVLMFKFFANEAIPNYIMEFFGKKINPLLIAQKSLMPTLIFFNIWASFGGQILIYTGAMDQIAPEIIEAGQVDGVKPMQEFFFLVLPMIMPTIATFTIASIAGLFTNQASLYSFFGENVDYSNYTIGYYLFILVNKSGNGKSMYTYASALGLVCTFIAFPLTLLTRRVMEGKED